MFRGRIKNIHFVGIGGSGMCGIAEVLVNMGYKVTGSDTAKSDVTRRLEGLGAAVAAAHEARNVIGADCVVYSSAIRPDNPELLEARRRQIPTIARAEMLAELMRMKYGIAVAGTHGKTTTTSIIAAVLDSAGLDPTVVTGGKLNSLGANAVLGGGEFLVAEADESDRSFLKLTPVVAVITSLDREHMENYGDMEDMMRAYVDFANKVPFYGSVVLCLDLPAIRKLLPRIERRHITYGTSAEADLRATNVVADETRMSFDVAERGNPLGTVTINLPGMHNVCNALAAVAVAIELGLDFADIKQGLESFAGVERRFQVKADIGGIVVVDDYGHHPVEVKAVLRAAKQGWSRRVVVVFQPHRYSRTRDLANEFHSAFNDADKLILMDIYPAGEDAVEGVSSERLIEGIKGHGHKDVEYAEDPADIPRLLQKVTRRGDMVITLGAGDVWKVADGFVDILRERCGSGDLKLVKTE